MDTRTQYIEGGSRSEALCEEEWRDSCLRGILSYPPGSQRLLVIDSMRAELVQQLSDSLVDADATVRSYEDCRRKESNELLRSHSAPPQDADLDILKAFRKEAYDVANNGGSGDKVELGDIAFLVSSSAKDVKLDDCSINRNLDFRAVKDSPELPPTVAELNDAQLTIRTVRDYLPQLVSVVLKSPPPFESRLLDPIDKLRQVIIDRCVEDANWGVDMCWLLEAEVGRAWKKLFEHRQQTGRRLIVVLPAEKAAVLAKIGNEKREAFDLLQDSEQATAYGHTSPTEEERNSVGSSCYDDRVSSSSAKANASFRPLSSLSLRRCSHFGDTMHFIDRLTRISLELRRVPTIHRAPHLHESLRELNRRLRRRMCTRGDVSLDVEDSRGPDDWPQHTDISTGLLQYSVHLPLDPKQSNRWPGGSTSEMIGGGVVRVLNIVVDECRILSSRERCPFLVHLEVAETGLNGRDSRMYASGAPGLGATIKEALSMSSTVGTRTYDDVSYDVNQEPYQIPSELLVSSAKQTYPIDLPLTVGDRSNQQADSIRGGSRLDENGFYPSPPDPDDMLASIPYAEMRQQQYEQLHHNMFADESPTENAMHSQTQRNPTASIREELLTKVFGQAWDKKCDEIRQASPFGKTEGWRLASFIMKAGEDIRREALVMQIIVKLNEWFQGDIPEENRPHLRPYTIMCVGGDAGLVECLNDAKSIDEVKKRTDSFKSLRDYFERAYGPPIPKTFEMHEGNGKKQKKLTFTEAQENFLRSLVGYSLVCYILQIKDRHNANILLDRDGNIIHIDFGFVLGDTPKMGKVPIFSERAPFKLSGEFWDVLGGWNVQQGGLGVRFCNMFEHAFASAASHAEEVVSLVEATMLTLTQNPRQARILANGIRSRLRMRGEPGSREQKAFVMELVNAALTSWGTSTYDWLQKNMNGYQ